MIGQFRWTIPHPVVDEEGYPVFQGIRGICVNIQEHLPVVQNSSPVKEFYRKVISIFVVENQDTTLDSLLSVRRDLFEELAKMRRRHFTCCHATDLPVPIGHTETNCEKCFLLSPRVGERARLKNRIKEQVRLMNKHLQDHTY
jgi:hypothetical protein